LGVLLESEVRITLTESPGTYRVVEGGVDQVLIVGWLAEDTVAGDECGSLKDCAHRKAGTQPMLGFGGLTGQIEPPAELVVTQSRREGQLVFPVLRLGVERRGVGVKSAGGRVGNRIARREIAQHAVEGAYLLAGVFTADVEVSRGPRADAEVEPAAQVLVLIPGDISLG
jgi:hypothetical protein